MSGYSGKIYDLVGKLEGTPEMSDEEFLEAVERLFDRELRNQVQQIMSERELASRDTAVYEALHERK